MTESSSNDDVKGVQQALEGLKLPHMPEKDQPPALRILVVADIDLNAASALAEYTLQQNNRVFDASCIDLCIACGSFCRDEDLLPYLAGKRQSEHRLRRHGNSYTPFFRSREEMAALEGLFTAALSQLESIVCRVVYVPGAMDPLTTVVNPRPASRLTPNSRNLHQQWLPLAPGLGCAALLYFDSPENVVPRKPAARERDDARAEDSDELDEDERVAVLHAQLQEMQLSSDGYCSTLERLLQLAPKPQLSVRFHSMKSQSILVTHYVDLASSSDGPKTETSRSKGEPRGSTPWPTQNKQHDKFCEAQPDLLSLEIASGSASQHPAQLITKGQVPVLLPGSLRERGEFCLLDLTLEDVVVGKGVEKSQSAPSRPSPKSRFAWKVNKVDFHHLHRYE